MRSIEAYFGKTSYVMFKECAYCHAPYDKTKNWNTYFSCNDDENEIVWWIVCDECYNAEIENEGTSDIEDEGMA